MRKFRTNFFAATAILCALFIGAMSFCCGKTNEQKEERTKANVENTLSTAQEAIEGINFENAEEAAKLDSIVTGALQAIDPEEVFIVSDSVKSQLMLDIEKFYTDANARQALSEETNAAYEQLMEAITKGGMPNEVVPEETENTGTPGEETTEKPEGTETSEATETSEQTAEPGAENAAPAETAEPKEGEAKTSK